MDKLYSRIKAVGFDALTIHERRYFAMWWFFAEVNNGGIHQYFFNDAGQLAMDVLDGFTDIGAVEIAGIVRQAIDVFPQGVVPFEQRQRRSALEAIGPSGNAALDSLSEKFYDSKEDVSALLQSFVTANKSQYPSLFEA
jgi:hypothetical protein